MTKKSPWSSGKGGLGVFRDKPIKQSWRVAENNASIGFWPPDTAAICELHMSQKTGHTGVSRVGIGLVCTGHCYRGQMPVPHAIAVLGQLQCGFGYF